MSSVFPAQHQNYNDEYFELVENDTMETQLVDETAWDLFTSIYKPQHDIYSVGDQTNETIPVITNVLEQHGLHGLNTGDIIEIIGNEQCGKTQLLYQYVINCCLPSKITVIQSSKNNKPTILELGGHHSKSIFFDLNLSFDVDRLCDIFKTQIKRKITKHNTRLDTLRAQHMNEPDIQSEQCLETMIEIDQRKFLQFEAKKLWKWLQSKISLVQPCSPIQFVASLHKLRSMLNTMYTTAVQVKTNNNQNDEYNEYSNGDNGMRLLLIDDINAFFSELTANKERDKYYNSISSLLMELCNEFGLIIFFSRYTQFRSEKQWLKKLLPLIDIKIRQKNNSLQLKAKEMFHSKFGKILLENKAIFVIYLYRETMEYFDSTVTHPAISNDLFLCNTGHDNEYDFDDERYLERKLYLTGDDAVTRKWVLMQSGKYLDPLDYVKRKQKEGNKKIFGKEDYNIIRGAVVTQQEFLQKAKKNINEHCYEDVILQRKMIKFHATISRQTGFVYHIQ